MSLRESPRLRDVWRMVARSAFTELRHSWWRLVACEVALAVLFVVPPVAAVAGVVAGRSGVAVVGAAAWALMAALHAPALRAFGVPRRRALLLPLVGVLYGAMTLDSALRSLRGPRRGWR